MEDNLRLVQQYSKMPRLSQKTQDELDEDFQTDKDKRRSLPGKYYVRWTKEENRQYALFVQESRVLLENLEERKDSMIFSKMAHVLKNGRNNHQCRSHHVKMLEKYGNIQKIIISFVSKSRRTTNKKLKPVLPIKCVPSNPLTEPDSGPKNIPQLRIYEEKSMEENQELFIKLSGPSFNFPI